MSTYIPENKDLNILKNKQPEGFYLFFIVNLLSAFPLTGPVSLLVLYLSDQPGFKINVDQPSLIVASFVALCAISMVVGGLFSDKLFGRRYGLIFGMILLSIGALLLAIPQHFYFNLGLALMVFGYGLFETSLAASFSGLFIQNDPRRQIGFYHYSLGGYVGVLLAALFCPIIASVYGWRYGFIAAGSVGLICAGILILNNRFLKQISALVQRKYISFQLLKLKKISWFMNFKNFNIFISPRTLEILALFCFLILIFIFNNHNIPYHILVLFIIAVLFTILIYCAFKYHKLYDQDQKTKFILMGIFLFYTIIIAIGVTQFSVSLPIFVDKFVDRNIFGIEIPSTLFYSISSLFIMIFIVIFGMIRKILDRKNKRISVTLKFFMATIALSLGFFTLQFAIYLSGPAKLSILWILPVYACISISMALWYPMAYPLIAILAPRQKIAVMLGVLCFANALGNEISGILAASAFPAGQATVTAQHFGNIYMVFAAIIALLAIILLIKTKKINAIFRQLAIDF